MNIFGVSYGTLLAQHFSRLYPTQVNSMILDGPVPMGIRFLDDQEQTSGAALNRYFEACLSHTSCKKKFPNLKADYIQVKQLFNTHGDYTIKDKDIKIDLDFFNTLINVNLRTESSYRNIPKFIRALAEQDDQIIEDFLFSDSTTPAGHVEKTTQPLEKSVRCAEFGLMKEKIFEYTQSEFEEECKNWLVRKLPIEYIKTHPQPNIPTLILTGDFDPITPVEYGEYLAKDSQLVTFQCYRPGS